MFKNSGSGLSVTCELQCTVYTKTIEATCRLHRMSLNAHSMIIPHTRRQGSPSWLQPLVRFFSELIFGCHYVRTACCLFFKSVKFCECATIHYKSISPCYTIRLYRFFHHICTYCGYIMQVLFDKALSRDLHLRKNHQNCPLKEIVHKAAKGTVSKIFFH
jgi:hypothetical protein